MFSSTPAVGQVPPAPPPDSMSTRMIAPVPREPSRMRAAPRPASGPTGAPAPWTAGIRVHTQAEPHDQEVGGTARRARRTIPCAPDSPAGPPVARFRWPGSAAASAQFPRRGAKMNFRPRASTPSWRAADSRGQFTARCRSRTGRSRAAQATRPQSACSADRANGLAGPAAKCT
jgi:hypothetical protein